MRRVPHGDAHKLSIPRALSRLIAAGDLESAERLVFSLPSPPPTSAFNSLICAFGRCRLLSRARHIFDAMPRRDLVSYNALLSAYSLSSLPSEIAAARRLFERIPIKDSISWNTMLNAYARNALTADALDLFRRIPTKCAVTWNTLLLCFLNAGDVEHAMQLFNDMPIRDAVSLNVLISGLIKNEKLELAEEILLQRVHEVSCTVHAYNTLIAGYGQRGRVEEARMLFYLLPKKSGREFRRNVVSWNTMLMCYFRSGDVESARALFDEMPERDSFSWNTMISGYVQSGFVDDAVKLFDKINNPDSYSWDSIICGLARRGELGRARELFDRMPCKTVISWNAMIAGCNENGDYEGAIELFAEMHAIDTRPDRHTLSATLSACAGIPTLRVGIQTHQLVVKSIVADTPISNALITMYSRCGATTQAEAVFNEMGIHQRDVVSWNAMIGGFAQHGGAERALEVFEDMKRVRVRPTYTTFISVLNACVHAGLVDEGRRQFDLMVPEFGITAGAEHFASLVDLLSRNGMLEEAVRVIKQMVDSPDKAVWGALLNGARIHNNPELARAAAKELAKVDPHSSAPYVMLYSVHADEERWDDAVGVRELMDRSGIVKHAGYSWIELGSRVDRFLAGDWSHPLSFEIHSVLESCDRVSRDRYAQLC